MLLIAAIVVPACVAGSPRVGVELAFYRLGPEQPTEVRAGALQCLWRGYHEPSVEPRRKDIVKAFRTAVDDPDEEVLRAACRGLAWTGEPGLDILLDLHGTGKAETIRWHAASHLGYCAEWHPELAKMVKERAIPVLAGDLKSGNKFVRNAALSSLKWLGPESLPHVMTVIGDKDSGRHAAEILVRYPKSAGPILAESLATDDAGAIINICWTITHIKAEGKPAVAKLTRHLAHRDSNVQGWAADAVGAIGPAARPSVPDLLKMYEVPDAKFTSHATSALPKIGMDADQVAPALAALPDGIGGVAETAVAVSVSAAGEKAVPAVTKAIESGRPVQRAVALAAAAKIGKPMAPAADAIRKLVPDDSYRDAAVDALLSAGVTAKVAVPFLMTDLETDWHETIHAGGRLAYGSAAGQRLGRIGADALPALKEGLKSDKEKVRKGSLVALKVLGPAARETIPLILECAKNRGTEVEIAHAALAAIDPEKHAPKKGRGDR